MAQVRTSRPSLPKGVTQSGACPESPRRSERERRCLRHHWGHFSRQWNRPTGLRPLVARMPNSSYVSKRSSFSSDGPCREVRAGPRRPRVGPCDKP